MYAFDLLRKLETAPLVGQLIERIEAGQSLNGVQEETFLRSLALMPNSRELVGFEAPSDMCAPSSETIGRPILTELRMYVKRSDEALSTTSGTAQGLRLRLCSVLDLSRLRVLSVDYHHSFNIFLLLEEVSADLDELSVGGLNDKHLARFCEYVGRHTRLTSLSLGLSGPALEHALPFAQLPQLRYLKLPLDLVPTALEGRHAGLTTLALNLDGDEDPCASGVASCLEAAYDMLSATTGSTSFPALRCIILLDERAAEDVCNFFRRLSASEYVAQICAVARRLRSVGVHVETAGGQPVNDDWVPAILDLGEPTCRVPLSLLPRALTMIVAARPDESDESESEWSESESERELSDSEYSLAEMSRGPST